jgi:hypothetical protein
MIRRAEKSDREFSQAELEHPTPIGISSFDIHSSFGIRHSSFQLFGYLSHGFAQS